MVPACPLPPPSPPSVSQSSASLQFELALLVQPGDSKPNAALKVAAPPIQ
jgi:hypothetical protein